MEETVRMAILSSLRERLNGPYSWMLSELEPLLEVHGGEDYQGSLRIGFNPKYGAGGDYYAACIIHGPVVQRIDHLGIPKPYVDLLRRFNGAKLYAIDLFGILEDESNRRRCMSLDHANRHWTREYRCLPERAFYFGGRYFSHEESIGYFYDASLRVFSARKSGQVLTWWASVEDMLRDEWDASKRMEILTRDRLGQS
jgi:hypothetical protein